MSNRRFEVSSGKLRFGFLYRAWRARAASRLLFVICLGVLTMAAVHLPQASLSRLWESLLSRNPCHNCAVVSTKVPEITSSPGTFANFDVTGAGTTALEGTGATSINASGDVAGIYITTGNVAHGFVRTSGGTITPFDVTGAGTGNDQGTFAMSIDADGNIAGMYADSGNVYHGFIRSSGGTITPFNVSAAGTTGHRGTMPISINGGVITGTYVTGSSGTTSVYHGFIRQTSGALTDPIDVPAAGSGNTQGTQPLAINSAGDITGTYSDASSVHHGFIDAAGTFTYPIDPSGSVATFPTSIDTAGDIAGVFEDSAGLMHGFVRLASTGAITVINAPGASTTGPGSGKGIKIDGTVAASINTSGTIAGFYTDSNQVAHGFYRTSSGTITSPLDDSSAGTGALQGTGATTINDSGVMAGAYIDSSSVLHGFVFTPTALPAAISFTPASLSFGNQALDVPSAAKSVKVKNTGTGTLNLESITPSAGFAISANTCASTLASGKTCKVSVTFTPPQLGKVTGSLQFSDNAPDSPQSVPLLGTGIVPAVVTPATATFAKQKVGTTSAAKNFTLINNESVELTGIASSTTGDFAVSATTCGTTLAAKARCTVSVTFTPTATGTRTGQLSVSDSAANSPQTAALQGVGD